MSDIIEQIMEVAKLARFLRDDAGIIVNANELAGLTKIVREGWELGTTIAQFRNEADIKSDTLEVLTTRLRNHAALVEDISKYHDQHLILINHLTRFSQNLYRMMRETPFIEDAEYRDELVMKKKTGFLIDEMMYHTALREIAALFSKLGESRPNEAPLSPLGTLLLQLGRLLGMVDTHIQFNVVYRTLPQLLIGLLQLEGEFQRNFRPIYWNVKHKYFQAVIVKSLEILVSMKLSPEMREDQPIKVKGLKKKKDLAEMLKSLERAFDKDSQNKQMPPLEILLPELK